MIKLKDIIKESVWDRKFGDPLPTLEDVMKESDDDNYVHVGGGRYKEVNKATGEPLPNSPSYIKKDGGGYEMVDDDDPRLSDPEKPDDEPSDMDTERPDDEPEDEPAGKLGGGDYERDGGEPEDKPFGGDTGKDADSDSDDSSGGKLVAIDYQEDGDTWQVELDGLDNDVVVPGSEADTEEEAEEVARKMAALGDDEFDPDKHGLDKYSSDIEDDDDDDGWIAHDEPEGSQWHKTYSMKDPEKPEDEPEGFDNVEDIVDASHEDILDDPQSIYNAFDDMEQAGIKVPGWMFDKAADIRDGDGDENDAEEIQQMMQNIYDRPEDFKETIKVINGKKYKAIKEDKKPTPLYEAKEEIRKMWERIK